MKPHIESEVNLLSFHGAYELNKLTSLPMCGFIAQLVEHRTGIAEVTGSNPFENISKKIACAISAIKRGFGISRHLIS